MDNVATNTLRKGVNSYWMPSMHEFFVFACLMAVLAIVFYLFHYNSIQRAVQQTRCYQLQDTAGTMGSYAVTAKNARNEDMYTVSYDLDSKLSAIECSCKEGNIVNTFRDIPMYDLIDQQERNVDKICQCDKQLLGVDGSTYYAGYPGIVRFMKDGDSSFFDTAYSSDYSGGAAKTSGMFNRH